MIKYALILMLIICSYCKGQNKAALPKADTKPENEELVTSHGPKNIVRDIIQDRKGNIWIASWDGVFKYDGKSFTNITSKVTSARFFSVLEDRNGNLWFGSIGSGVYLYDGKSFRNFTTKDGLAGNDVGCIYEDRTGNIWFGTGRGASRYNGRSFRNYTMKEGLSNNDVNAIIEDKKGKFWFGTRGDVCIYDGKRFTVLTHNGKPFTNVWSVIEDRRGNIWLGGSDGLWRYDGSSFANFTQEFIGAIIEDKKGNIWTNGSINDYGKHPALARYEGKSLSDKKPAVTEIKSKAKAFCLLEANDGSIWFGSGTGVHRYDGSSIKDFNEINSVETHPFSGY
ncbi:MAG: histidine kinase [Bacteroidetes bacterium]|jgi:ligand-binding sensor domain-containing protein|nr:histidine kinase [Bacteroidota bacterium]